MFSYYMHNFSKIKTWLKMFNSVFSWHIKECRGDGVEFIQHDEHSWIISVLGDLTSLPEGVRLFETRYY